MSTTRGITRRFFAKAAMGVSAAMAGVASTGTALANVAMHKVLGRPYVQIRTCEAQTYKLFDSLSVHVTANAPVRIKVEIEGMDESVLELTTTPAAKRMCLLGVHKTRAELPLKVTLSSKKPFQVHNIQASYMNPAFRREDGMLIFSDPFYKPMPDGVGVGVQYRPINRKAAAVDVRY